MMRSTLATLAGLTIVALATNAAAAPTVETTDTKDGYEYIYDADKLNADGLGNTIPIIKVRNRATRRTLIRPRATFVPELLKSAESV